MRSKFALWWRRRAAQIVYWKRLTVFRADQLLPQTFVRRGAGNVFIIGGRTFQVGESAAFDQFSSKRRRHHNKILEFLESELADRDVNVNVGTVALWV